MMIFFSVYLPGHLFVWALYVMNVQSLALKENFGFRKATNDDVAFARKALFQNAMNPLSISERNLLCSYEVISNNLVGFGQVRQLPGGKDYELASLYVKPAYRQQGVGSALVGELLRRFEDEHICGSIFLLTLEPLIGFYEPFGFSVIDDISAAPEQLQFEFKAGSIISMALGNSIKCMCR
mmetsp:Transcript_2691/g.3737  ORF Transcript_2691/g.3737 Transcript_2691/m.3737 type:complete len:181 (-) Transcript_2691:161-703(-)